MAVEHILGEDEGVETGASTVRSDDGNSSVVYVEGQLSVLEGITDLSAFVPDGMELVSSRVDPTDPGFGRISITCKDIGDGSAASFGAIHTTWRIDMVEEQTPLQQHPDIPKEDRIEIYKWLATDQIMRFNANGDPQWVDENGNATPVAQPYALKFVACYLRGIETFVRYFPVVQKISTYKRLPGATMNKTSTTGGTVSQFSADLGTFDVPDLTLNGYANGGWFKSGDDYVSNPDNLKWTRTQEWRWTPDYNDSDINWIYRRRSS